MAKRAGDYAAAPANRAAGILLWASSTSIQALWTPKAGVVDLAGTDHVLVYLDNVVQADRGNKRSYTFNTALGYVPRVCWVSDFRWVVVFYYYPDDSFDGLRSRSVVS